MTIQKTIAPATPIPTINNPLTGNPEASGAAAKAHAVLDALPAAAERIKLSDLPTKKLRLLALAEAIEREDLVAEGIGFNMGHWRATQLRTDTAERLDMTGHTCGTVACIAGWTSILEDGAQVPKGTKGRAMEILKLSPLEAHALFYAGGAWDHIERITTKTAVAVIRDFAETGSIHWGHFNEAERERHHIRHENQDRHVRRAYQRHCAVRQ